MFIERRRGERGGRGAWKERETGRGREEGKGHGRRETERGREERRVGESPFLPTEMYPKESSPSVN